MSKTWKRFLSLLLVATMILSLGVTGFAMGDEEETEEPLEETTDVPEELAEETEPEGKELEIIDISPDKLNVPRLGLESNADEEELIPMDSEDLNQVVRVSIFLDEPSTLGAGYAADGVGTNGAAIAYRDELRAQHEAMKAAIAGVIGHELDVEWDLTLAVNAISANVTLGEMVKIAEIPGVRAVQRENLYYPQDDETADPNTANTSENMVGATAAWEMTYTGAGSRIAIIDTGIDVSHQSFAEEPFLYSVGQAGATDELMTQADINNVLSQLNVLQKMSDVTAAQLNQNGQKIVYGFNYVDRSLTIDHMHDSQGEHGSHVAGIAAANRYIDSAHNDAAATVGAVGMAPDAQLLIMKVFGSSGGAYDSDYMVAIEDAILLEADVANLSLGSAVQGWTYDNEYQDMILNWANGEHNSKMVLSISAGNSFDLAYLMNNHNLLYKEDVSWHTGGSPGTFLNSLCVAAAQNTITKGTPMEFNGSQDVYYYESTGNEEDGTTYTNPALTTIVGTYDYVYIDAAGSAADYSTVNSAVSLSGKVVIVNRGELSFVEKGENAKSYNPKAVIIANNQDGTIYMDLTDFTGTFPMVTITQKDANKIKEGGTAHTANGITYYTGSMKVTNTEKEEVIDRSEATITAFSSWGVPGSLLMKPEITAPGGDIWSVWGANTGADTPTDAHNQYENMSGTSMAAPHIAGLTAVLAEYLRENDPTAMNSELAGYTTRAITQSLLMSTATPMIVDGNYLPILQQGAGLVEVSKAVTAPSVVMMHEEQSGLTGKTGAAKDGKVKVELGDDPDRKGDYSFSFYLYNITDKDLTYTLDGDIFTQDIEGANNDLASKKTTLLGADVSFYWSVGHDVDMDGDTDNDDAQAILDYLTGEVEEDEVNLSVADMDGDEEVTSYDAYLLIDWTPSGDSGTDNHNGPTGVVPANGKAFINVRVQLSAADKELLDLAYPGGAFIEGFVLATCTTSTEENVDLRHTHSIPILGFYGSWTDATMFDTVSYTDKLYGSEQLSYTGNETTNYLTMQMNGATVKFSGNPYMVEDVFPADRLAINSNTKVLNIVYNLVRAAGTTGFAVTKLDADGKVTDVVNSSIVANKVTGMFYSNSDGWQGLTQKLHGVNKTPGDYGLNPGERFRIGFYAIPEYNAMVVNNDYTSADAGVLDKTGFDTLLMSNVLGSGAFVGYDFVIDNEAPELESPSLNGSQLTVTASDNQALAYVAVMSLDGETVYSEAAPGESTYSVTIDASNAIANANGYVAVFVGDYAGNEAAKAVKVNNNTHVEKTIYVLTNSLTAGNDYLVVSSNTAGTTGSGLAYTTPTNNNATTANPLVYTAAIKAGTTESGNQPYIESSVPPATGVWTAGSGVTLSNVNGTKTWYIGRSGSNALTINTNPSSRNWSYTNNRLRSGTSTRYLYFNGSAYTVGTATTTVYLYQKTTISYDVEPYGVSSVTITPDTLDLYKNNTANLTAKVLPLTATDRTVTWSSANPAVATVDEFGNVKAVAAGTTTIRATANGDTTKFAECAVKVTSVNKNLNAIIWDEEGAVYFSSFNANNLPTWTKLHNDEVGTYLTSAFQNTNSALYAGTLDTSSVSTTIYTVNATTYALTEYGKNYVGAFGMARASSRYTDFFVYGFAKYLICGNLAPKEDEEAGGTYSGLPYGLLDVSKTAVGDAYVAGVCAKNIGTTSSGFYFLDETGKIWKTTMTIGTRVTFGTPTLVVDTGIGTSFLYQSIYYDGTYIYWSHQTDNEAELIIVDPSTGAVYHAGNFGVGVWPAAGLFVKGSIAPASVEDDVVAEGLPGAPVASYTDLVTAEVIERITAEFAKLGFYVTMRESLTDDAELDEEIVEPVEEPIEEPAPVEEPIVEPAPVEEPIEEPAPVEEGEGTENVSGGLNALHRPAVKLAAPVIPTVDPNANQNVTLPIAETEDSHNGMITVVYDPETMTYVDFTANENVSILSVHPDTEKGVITIAYANKAASGSRELPVDSVRGGFYDFIDAGTAIVELHFTISCTSSEGEITTLERNDAFDLNEDDIFTVNGTGHDWGAPAWEWAEDYSTATAAFVCRNNAEHTEELTAVITSKITAATCEEGGKTVYTATVKLDGKTYTDTREVTTEAIGHAWGEPTWTWAEDYSTATAAFVCTNDQTHILTLDAVITTESTPTTIVYTATVELDGETYTDTKTVVNDHEHADADGDLFCDTCGERMGVLVSVTSASGTLDGPTVAFVKGGAKLYFGESTTVEASNVAGYTFDGWYLNGEKVSDQLRYSYTAPEGATEDVKFVALYIGSGTFRLTVTGSKFTISGLAAAQRNYFDDLLAANTQVTVTFQGSADESFLYWVNDNGKIVSTSTDYTFYMVAHTKLHAVCAAADASQNEALVVFVNSRSNGQVLASHYYTATDAIAFPAAPSMMGREFAGWSMTEEEIKAKMATDTKIVVYAVFAAATENYSVTVSNNVNEEQTVYTRAAGEQFTINADLTLGSFSYWMMNGKIVSYDTSIAVRSMTDLALTAVYNETVEPVPVITMTEAYGTPVSDYYTVTFVAMRGVPEGWTVQRQGIVYTNRTDLAGLDLSEIMVLDGSGMKEYTSSSTDRNGVCVLNINTRNARIYHARGFMILMKDGVTQTIYSDEILEFSYTP